MTTDTTENTTLSQYVTIVLENYFNNLDGQHTTNLYNMVLSQVEKPLLEIVLQKTNNNQTITANVLGLSRGTLRKKMQQYELLD